jgi:8-oxo-dGTP pyrophosphatase MutT (NUDIX family)
MIAPASIVPATTLLGSVLQAPVAGFAPLWFRNELIGAVSPAWLPRLDSRLFKLQDDAGGDLPVVRIRGGDRRSESGLVPAATLNRWFAQWALELKEQGLLPGWRGESVQLYGANEATPLLEVERALLRPLGLMLRTVQVNVFSFQDKRLEVWVAQRAASKAVDPDKLDSLVGGGIQGADTPLETLVRECQEEAGIPRNLARRAVPVGVIDSSSGAFDAGEPVFHRERAMLYDLKVPLDFIPKPMDGETAAVECFSAQALQDSLASGRWTQEGAWATRDLLRRYATVAAAAATPAAAAPRMSAPSGPAAAGAAATGKDPAAT